MHSRGNVGGGEGREKGSLTVGMGICWEGLTGKYEVGVEQEKGKGMRSDLQGSKGERFDELLWRDGGVEVQWVYGRWVVRVNEIGNSFCG